MQIKPNLPDAQMNVSPVKTKDYENKRLADAAKTNPIQSQYKPNTNPIPEMSKMNVTSILTKDYENERPRTPPKQTQFKPKQTQPVVSLSNLFLKIPDNFSSQFQRRKPTILNPDVSVCHGLVCKKFML